MKKFTVKDFILSTSPCFGCGSRLAFYMAFEDFSKDAFPPHKPMVITGESSSIDIRTTYNGSLKLTIFHKTNKFQTNDLQSFKEFLKTKKLFINVNCQKCQSSIDTRYLDLNLEKGFIKPVGVGTERITLSDSANKYVIYSSSFDANTIITIIKQEKGIPHVPVRLEVPMLPMAKFKNKERMIEKIKLYLLFS